jgi:hypothetical protein
MKTAKLINFTVPALLALIGWLGTAGPARASVYWGATASGTARQFEITCGTCPNPVTTLSSLSDGGFGIESAKVDFSDPGLVAYLAAASLGGANSLPSLGALATANIGTGAPSTFFYAGSAVARGTQLYTYMGGTPAAYTLDYTIDGRIAGGILTQIFGGFTVFGAGYNPNQEGQPVLGFSFDSANGDATDKLVHLTGSVTFNVNPGEIFYVQATLSAFADSRSQQLFASADASHTLTMSFSQGNTSLLVPAAAGPAADAPEPGGALLPGIGLVLVVAACRGLRRPFKIRTRFRRERS